MAARTKLPTRIPCWVCLECLRVFTTPRPTRGRGGQNAETRHKVYDHTVPGSGSRGFKLGTWRWCGPIVEWVIVPLRGRPT